MDNAPSLYRLRRDQLTAKRERDTEICIKTAVLVVILAVIHGYMFLSQIQHLLDQLYQNILGSMMAIQQITDRLALLASQMHI